MLTPEQQKWGDCAPSGDQEQLDPHRIAQLRRRIWACGFGQWVALAMTLIPALIVAYYSHWKNVEFTLWEKAPAILSIIVGIVAALALGALRRGGQKILLLQNLGRHE